jgi:hypothetical protein
MTVVTSADGGALGGDSRPPRYHHFVTIFYNLVNYDCRNVTFRHRFFII